MSDDQQKKRIRAFETTESSGEEEDTVWLLSYADLMTLLFTFFVVLYSLALQESNHEVAKSLAGFFGGTPGAGYPFPGEEIKKDILEQAHSDDAFYGLETLVTSEGLEITFGTTVLFDSGSAELRPQLEKSFNGLIAILKEKAPQSLIRVEGHTDDAPIGRSVFKSNWELSGARAAAVIRKFAEAGFAGRQLTAVGFADSRPRKENRGPAGEPIAQNQAVNRRVVLTIADPNSKHATPHCDSK